MLEKQKVDIHTNAHMDRQCSTVEVTSPLITHMMLLDTYVHIFILAQHTRFDGRPGPGVHAAFVSHSWVCALLSLS